VLSTDTLLELLEAETVCGTLSGTVAGFDWVFTSDLAW
jgi:hypothetical protein